jgi:hypothetical protein
VRTKTVLTIELTRRTTRPKCDRMLSYGLEIKHVCIVRRNIVELAASMKNVHTTAIRAVSLNIFTDVFLIEWTSVLYRTCGRLKSELPNSGGIKDHMPRWFNYVITMVF